MRLRMKSTVLALALAGLSLPAYPAGMGKLTVMSGLGQPLRAEVELSVTREELSSLSARVAPVDAFKQAGIEFAPVLAAIKFEIAKRPDGKSILKLSSDRPIGEPFLDMLIQLDWAQGRLVREYTFLLDPPDAVFAKQQVAPVAPAESPKVPAPAKPAAAAAPAKAEPAEPVSAPAAAAAATREVKRGDTLGRIAAETKPDGITLDQMLVALFRANKPAFIGSNMNRLRTGAILNIPDKEAAAGVTAGEARKVVVAQSADFNAYRRRIAAAAAATVPAQAEAGQTATGKIAARVEEKAPAPAEQRDQLKVSKTDAKGQKEAQQRIAGLEEDLVTKEKALKEANSRLTDLEKNVGELQKLVELKNQQMAELQKQAAAGKSAAPAKPSREPSQPSPSRPSPSRPSPSPPRRPSLHRRRQPPRNLQPSRRRRPPPPLRQPRLQARSPKRRSLLPLLRRWNRRRRPLPPNSPSLMRPSRHPSQPSLPYRRGPKSRDFWRD